MDVQAVSVHQCVQLSKLTQVRYVESQRGSVRVSVFLGIQCLIATVPCVLIAIREHTVPVATDKHLVINANNRFPDWTKQAKGGHVSLCNAD